MEQKRRMLIGGGIAALVVILVAAALVVRSNDDGAPSRPGMRDGDPAAEAADAFAAAWAGNTLDRVPVTKASGTVGARSLAASSGLGLAGKVPASVAVTEMEQQPPATPDGDARSRATLKVSWKLDADRTWSYTSSLDLVEQAAVEGAKPVWLVDWKPSVVHPRLQKGDKLTVVRLVATRGEILGPDGKALVGIRPVVQISIQPGATTDRTAAAQQVAGLVGVDSASLVDRVVAAGAGTYVSVVTLRKEAFDPISASLEAIPGVIVRADEIPLAPTRDFARALIGILGPASADDVARTEGRVALGEYTGLSGLQASQDETLAGRAGLSIRLLPADGNTAPSVLKEFPTEPGKPITITIDPEIQAAADAALRSAPKAAALVAIRASTGDVLAVANGPAGSDSYNRALIGKYPPGSTFKIASGFTLLENGLTPDTVVDCPATIVVGKEFSNAEGEVLGKVPFRKDFADSCNTAFVGQSRTITSKQLTDTAAKLGYRSFDLGIPVFGGSVPLTESETEHAANMIGQGKVEASPFAVAVASASAASGRSVQPRLIIDPANPEPKLGAQLSAGAVADLQSLMRGVVTNGTGGAVLGIPGGPVSGKTGTAEFGTEDPPQTHAWFTGFQGDIAFAVLVEDSGFGGQVAAPLAADFLSAIAAG